VHTVWSSRAGLVAALMLLVGCSGRVDHSSKPAVSDAAPSPTVTPAPTSARATPAAPKGPWLAYQVVAGDGDGIFLVRTDGSDSHQILAELPGEQIHPDWSPGGTELAFINAVGDTAEVWISLADGRKAHRVASCTGRCLAYDYVAWAPRGRRLLMMRYDGPSSAAGVPASSSLELLDLVSGDRHEVARSAANELFSSPRVSRDGNLYCVTTEIGDTGSGPTGTAIAVGSIVGGRVSKVTDPRAFGSYCDWRPRADGELVFTDHDLSVFDDMTVSSNLFTIHADGSHLQQLTHFATGRLRATQPRWTPDGRRILFTSVNGDGSLRYRHMVSWSLSRSDVEPVTEGPALVGTHPTLQR